VPIKRQLSHERRKAMIQRCSACGMIYGHKAPFLDTTEIRGVCKDCHTLFLQGIQMETREHQIKKKHSKDGVKRRPAIKPASRKGNHQIL
jgi:RNase P subunit RPR2